MFLGFVAIINHFVTKYDNAVREHYCSNLKKSL